MSTTNFPGRTSTEDRDLGYDKLLEDLAGIGSEPHVLAGIRQQEGEEIESGDDINLATIAAINEFGAGSVPSRPFLRSTVDKNQKKYAGLLEKAITNAVDGKATVEEGLELLGLHAVRDIQRTIRDNDFDANAPATIEAKGSSKPLIDTGRLRQSIDFEIGE